MGTLAGCLKRLNITGVEADLIRQRAHAYKVDGMAPEKANQLAAQDMLEDLQAERQGILDQLPHAIQQELKEGGLYGQEARTDRQAMANQAGRAERLGADVRDTDRRADVPRSRPRKAPGEGGGIKTHLGLAQQLDTHGTVDLRGLDVSTPEKQAEVGQMVRNRNIEILRFWVSDENGKILQQFAVTSRKPGMVVPFMNDLTRGRMIGQLKALMQKTGATRWGMVHNHPSGNPRPSEQDVALTRFLEQRIPGYQGHVVVNHQRYAYIGRQGEQFGEQAYDIRPIQNVDLRADAPENPLNNQVIDGPDAVADLGKAVQAEKGYGVAIFTTTEAHGERPRTVAIQEIPGHTMAQEQFAGYLRNATPVFGANQVYLYFPEPMPAAELQAMRMVRDQVVREAVVSHKGLHESLSDSVVRSDAPAMTQGETVKQLYDRAFRVAEPDPRYGKEPPKSPPKNAKPIPESDWTASEPTAMDDFRYLFQDQHIDTRKTVGDIKKALKVLGDQAQQLPDVLDPMNYINTYGGKQDDQLKLFERNELKPLTDAMRKAGVTADQLNDFLMALTAEEANAYFQSINPKENQSDLFEEDWDNTALSGMSNADAQAILDKADHAVMLPLADKVFQILHRTREKMVEYGEISPETAEQWERENPHYIPRRREGFQDEEHEHGRPAGLAVQGKIVKTALGSQRKVVDVLGNIVAQRAKVINRGERMRPVLALSALFIRYPNPKFVKLTKPLTYTYIDPATGLKQTAIFGNAEKGPLKRVWDPKEKKVKWIHQTHDFFADHVVPFKVQGKTYGLVFNRDDPRAKRMARGLKGLDMSVIGGDTEKAVHDKRVKWIAGLAHTWAMGTRYIAAMNTQYSPAFGPWNFMRDLLFASATLENSPLQGRQGPILRSAMANVKHIYQATRAIRRGEDLDTDFVARFERFQHAGGQTGYRDLYLTGEEQAKEIEKMLRPGKFQEHWEKLGGQAVADWVQDYNAAFENATRLAVFEAALRAGMPEVKAASMAKDVTVNFNRKGVKSNQLGALYAFFNVTLQSTERVVTTMFEQGSYGKLTAAGKKILYGGMLLGSMQAFLLAMNDWEDDEPPEFIKVRSLVIPAPGTEKGYIAIPMPLGFNIFPNIGRLATEAVIYGDAKDKFWKLVDSVYGVTDPLGGSSTFWQDVSPTLTDPFVQLYENKDWTGRPIYREDFLPTKPTPGHTRGNHDAADWAVWTSYAVNYLFGGTEYSPGSIGETTVSPPPEVFEHLLGFFAGGPGREANKVSRILKAWEEGKSAELYNIPLIGKLIGVAAGTAQDWSRWRENMMTLHLHKLEIEGRKGDGRALREYRKEYPMTAHISYGQMVENRLRKYLKRRRELNAKEDSKLVRTEKDRLDQRIKTLITNFNTRLAKTENTQTAR